MALIACGSVARAGVMVATVDPDATRVTFTLDATAHVVHGTLGTLGGEVRLDPATGLTTGEIRIDARSAETGNDRRDRKMHAEVLESGTFPLILLRPRTIVGRIGDGSESDVTIRGELVVHGAPHDVELPASIRVSNGRFTAKLSFTVPFVEWGMKDPSFFLLRVAKEVQVDVSAEGTLAPEQGASP